MPTMGSLRCFPFMPPKNGAPSLGVTAPAPSTVQYPSPVGLTAIASLPRAPAGEAGITEAMMRRRKVMTAVIARVGNAVCCVGGISIHIDASHSADQYQNR